MQKKNLKPKTYRAVNLQQKFREFGLAQGFGTRQDIEIEREALLSGIKKQEVPH